MNSKLRYSIEIIENDINVIVNKNYFKYIKYKFMNLHSLGYILTDLISGVLLANGYATLHCSAVNIGQRSLMIFAPPSTGKTITAIKLCENENAKFISEDIAITDGENIYSVPWTSAFRFYNHEKESKFNRFADILCKNIPIFQLLSIKKQKSFDSFYNFYINNKRDGLPIIKTWIRFLWNTKSVYIDYFLRKIGIYKKSIKLSADVPSNPGAPSYLFNWGVHEMIKRYEKANIERWWMKSITILI